jgi:hypothetical protein
LHALIRHDLHNKQELRKDAVTLLIDRVYAELASAYGASHHSASRSAGTIRRAQGCALNDPHPHQIAAVPHHPVAAAISRASARCAQRAGVLHACGAIRMRVW